MTSATETKTWETVVGLEVHCELSTASKLFCGCRNEFGNEPNTNVCPVCLGLPGSLPVLNEKAVEYALRVAEALDLDVPERSVFSRKNYFYPDMPKDYQTSQYDLPITINGELEVDGERIGITRAHLEEDTGKTLHIGGGGRIHDAEYSLVDYNRAGVPLLEIVSEPDIRSAEQAKRYVEELRATLLAIGVSDVKMEEGSLRIDANVSVRPVSDTEFGTRCEIKNLNSLRSLVKAIEHEARRQVTAREFGDAIVQETRHWDEARGRTISGRSKEEAHDYRYFPEPDLVPVAPTAEMRAEVRATLPELPRRTRERLVETWGIKEDDARVIVGVPGLVDIHRDRGRGAEVGLAPRRRQLGPPGRAEVRERVRLVACSADARRCSRSSSTSSPRARSRVRRPRTCSTSHSRKTAGRATSSKRAGSRR